jgi:HlyD family secretion protein
MSRTKKLVIGGLALIAVLAIVAFSLTGKDRNLPKVTTGKVEKADLVSRVTANGKIQARDKVDMSALVMGQIVNLAVKEGDHVKKGQFLLQIDKVQYAAQAEGKEATLAAARHDLESARSAAEQAKIDYERAKQNYDAKILPEADYQHAKTTWQQADAALAASEQRMRSTVADLAASKDWVSKTTVTAPLDGVVTALPVKEGEVTVVGTMNNPGTQLLTISDMSFVEAVMMVDETDMPNVKVGQKAVVNIDAYPDHPFDGIVTEAGSSPIPKNDPDLEGLTTTSDAINFKVRIKVLSPPETIRPGYSVTADIITANRVKALSVPLASVVIRDSPTGERTPAGKIKTEQGVYAVENGKIKFLKIKSGISGELMIEVTEGLTEGRDIVTGPFKALRTLKEGDRVTVEKPAKKGSVKKAATPSAG